MSNVVSEKIKLISPDCVHKLCRSCLCEVNEDYFWLESYYLERNIIDIYKNVTSIKIELSDNLPKKLCTICYNHIIKFDLFKTNVLKSEKLLTEQVLSASTKIFEDEMEIKIEHIVVKTENRFEYDDAIGSIKEDSDSKNEIFIAERLYEEAEPDDTQKDDTKNTNVSTESYETKERYIDEVSDNSLEEKQKSEERKRFLRPSSKTVHEMTTHKSEKHFFCSICGKGFKHQYFLNKHMTNIHNNSQMKDKHDYSGYQCPICGNFYKTRSSLNVHKLKHERPKPFICNICGNGYCTKAVLENHQKIHTGEKSYGCNVCNKKFRCKGSLKTHELVHSGEKPLSCHICKKLFRQHAHLNTHMKGQHFINDSY